MLQIHAEKLVARLMAHHKIQPELLPFYLFRVRSTGKIAPTDLTARTRLPRCDEAMLQPFQENPGNVTITV